MTGEVLKRTRASKKSAADLSSLAEALSSAFQEVAGNVSAINHNAEHIRLDVHDIAEECSTLTDYTIEMNTRADTMQLSAQTSAKTTDAKTKELLCTLNDAIAKSHSVDQIQTLTGEILAIAQQTQLIALNASVEAAHAGLPAEALPSSRRRCVTLPAPVRKPQAAFRKSTPSSPPPSIISQKMQSI